MNFNFRMALVFALAVSATFAFIGVCAFAADAKWDLMAACVIVLCISAFVAGGLIDD